MSSALPAWREVEIVRRNFAPCRKQEGNMGDSYVFDAGWFFFAAWSVMLALVAVTAFGRDLIPSQVRRQCLARAGRPEPLSIAKTRDHSLPRSIRQ